MSEHKIMFDIDTKVSVIIELYDAGKKIGIGWVCKDGTRNARSIDIPEDILNEIRKDCGI